VTQRAHGHCEFCRSPYDFSSDTFEIEHFIPLSKGGNNNLDNLALSCGGCNSRKRDYLTGFDILTSSVVLLFNPREEEWKVRFG